MERTTLRLAHTQWMLCYSLMLKKDRTMLVSTCVTKWKALNVIRSAKRIFDEGNVSLAIFN